MALKEFIRDIKRLSDVEIHQLMQFLSKTITPLSSQEPIFHEVRDLKHKMAVPVSIVIPTTLFDSASIQ